MRLESGESWSTKTDLRFLKALMESQGAIVALRGVLFADDACFSRDRSNAAGSEQWRTLRRR